MSAYSGRGVHKQVVEELGRRIVQGAFTAYEPIDLNELEREFDVSRTAMREAIKVLTAKGMLDARQRRGTFVLPRSRWALLDQDVMRWEFTRPDTATLFSNLAEVRRITEPAIARIAAARRTDVDLAELDAALDTMATAAAADTADGDSMAEADITFHRALAAATHNEMLVRIAALISIGLDERDHAVPVHLSDPVPSHRAVVLAVAGRDEAGAEAAMKTLLDLADEDVARLAGEPERPAERSKDAER